MRECDSGRIANFHVIALISKRWSAVYGQMKERRLATLLTPSVSYLAADRGRPAADPEQESALPAWYDLQMLHDQLQSLCAAVFIHI